MEESLALQRQDAERQHCLAKKARQNSKQLAAAVTDMAQVMTAFFKHQLQLQQQQQQQQRQ